MSKSVFSNAASTAQYYANLTDNANIGAPTPSPLVAVRDLFPQAGREVLLKMETGGDTHSFKWRGALVKMQRLLAEGEREVITASAGNHAQGVAQAAASLGMNATIVMPVNTPEKKKQAVRKLNPNATVILHGETFAEALALAKQIEKEKGLTFVHPYDDPFVIAGQGTVVKEVFAEYPAEKTEAVFVPVGGGGFLAGTAAWVEYHHPFVKVFGVELEGADSMRLALAAGERITMRKVDGFCEGTAVAQVGQENLRVAKELRTEIITVSRQQVSAAAMHIFGATGVMPESSGALALAGVMKYAATPSESDKALIAMVSGANVDAKKVEEMKQTAAKRPNFAFSTDEQRLVA